MCFIQEKYMPKKQSFTVCVLILCKVYFMYSEEVI